MNLRVQTLASKHDGLLDIVDDDTETRPVDVEAIAEKLGPRRWLSNRQDW